MNERIKFTRKLLGIVASAACLMFAAVIVWAALPSTPPAQNFANSGEAPSRVVVHGVGFDRSGQLTDGSRAALDDAAEILKQDPNAMVSVDQQHESDPNGGGGLTPAQTRKIARYIEARGIPAPRLMLCQATPFSAVPAQE